MPSALETYTFQPYLELYASYLLLLTLIKPLLGAFLRLLIYLSSFVRSQSSLSIKTDLIGISILGKARKGKYIGVYVVLGGPHLSHNALIKPYHSLF
jgi:hypothetical protein